MAAKQVAEDKEQTDQRQVADQGYYSKVNQPPFRQEQKDKSGVA